jgi:hypothetical protein
MIPPAITAGSRPVISRFCLPPADLVVKLGKCLILGARKKQVSGVSSILEDENENEDDLLFASFYSSSFSYLGAVL